MTDKRVFHYVPDVQQKEAFSINGDGNTNENYYRINVPFYATYEFCNGTDDDDYINIVTCSPEGYHYSQESYAYHNKNLNDDVEHSHDYYEFMFVLYGTLTQRIEGRDFKYPAGTCCLIGRHLLHYEGFTGETGVFFLGLSVEYVRSLFNHARSSLFTQKGNIFGTELYKFMMNEITNDEGKKYYLDFIPIYKYNDKASETVHDLTSAIVTVLLNPTFGSEYAANAIICEFLNLLSGELYHCTCFDLSLKSDHLLFSRIEKLMKERNGRLSREELSNALNYSSDYLSRIVKKHTGMCLYDYGMTFCLRKAAQMLLKTDESISNIAYELKFSNPSQLYKLFKNMYGVTPSVYRKMNGNI